ncbi:hypothetical protein J6590_013250 [Homalodisca vitripennis]|nr:hypothetical protein J6590_013250 [Homalodisca vitripennis]
MRVHASLMMSSRIHVKTWRYLEGALMGEEMQPAQRPVTRSCLKNAYDEKEAALRSVVPGQLPCTGD